MNVKKEIVDAIETIVNSVVKKACSVITTALCISVEDDFKCVVQKNNTNYNVKYFGVKPTENVIYPLFIPFNKMNLAFIISIQKDSGDLPPSSNIIAWGKFSGVNVATKISGENFASVTRSNTGVYNIEFVNSMSDINYSVVVSGEIAGPPIGTMKVTNMTTEGFSIVAYGYDGYGTPHLVDSICIMFIVTC